MDAQGQLGFGYVQVGQVSSCYFIRLQQGTGTRDWLDSGLCHCCPVQLDGYRWMGTARCHPVMPGPACLGSTETQRGCPWYQLCARGDPGTAGSPPTQHSSPTGSGGCAPLPALPFSTGTLQPLPEKSSPRNSQIPPASDPQCASLPASPAVLPSALRAHRSCPRARVPRGTRAVQRRSWLCLRLPAQPGARSPVMCLCSQWIDSFHLL